MEATAVAGAAERIAGLDGLRGVAIAVVVVHHWCAAFAPRWFGTVLPGGFLGVDLFFVLSGYLITSILMRTAGSEDGWLGDFYRRRAFRLLPALAFLVAVVWAVSSAGFGLPGDLAGTTIAVAVYVLNWARVDGLQANHYLHHLWSLSVEEQFYLVWPVVFVVAGRRAAHVAALGVVAVVVWRASLVGDWSHLYWRTDARADALLIGCLVAISPAFRAALARWAWAGGAVFGLAVLAVHPGGMWLHAGGFTVIALACAAMIAGVVERGGGLLERRWLVALGVGAYSLYLWHYAVWALASHQPYGVWWGTPLAFWLAWTSWRFVESPFLRISATRRRGLDTVPGDRPLGGEVVADDVEVRR